MTTDARGIDAQTVRDAVARALDEDRARHDITTLATVDPTQRARGGFLLKEAGVVCGMDLVKAAFTQLSSELAVDVIVPDGSVAESGQLLAEVSGPLAPMLSAERIALNFLQRLSGIATITEEYVREAAEGGSADVLDTRKTTPGMRELERYAVRIGGARNHRNTLEDGVLIKDNHIAAGVLRGVDIAALVQEARWRVPHTLRVEVEVDTGEQARTAVAAGADIVLLDNMKPELMASIVQAHQQGVLFEASGGVTLDTIRAVAASGVHLISVGALTHSAPSLDISLEIEASR
ncbi:MAG TPA: carboxylating nicotinate-nucleotide diphosphorylase [Dehalococcoidia bacterium]|nr:carboxylating nicotinate-nucleotide diphosphorylase [Dehalococcoidia bacterium]